MYTRLGRCQQISFTSGSLQTFLSFSLKQSVAIGHQILIIVRIVSYISHMINSEIKESSLKRIYREKEEHLRVLLCLVRQTWLPSWLPASATLPSSIPSIHRNPFDPFPLSRSNAVAVLFFLPSHPLSGSFALIHRSPYPSLLASRSSTFPGLLSSLVDEEQERGSEMEREGRLSFTSTNECRSFNVTMRRPLRTNCCSTNITVRPIRNSLSSTFCDTYSSNWLLTYFAFFVPLHSFFFFLFAKRTFER